MKVMLIVIDDVGVDYIKPYYQRKGQTWDVAESRTIILEDFAQNGLMFHRAYSMPVCSHTRYTLHTGRVGFRSNLGTVIQPANDEGGRMSLSENYLPEILRDYAGVTDSAFFGKWHLTDNNAVAGGNNAPTLQGYATWKGFRGNLGLSGGGYTDYDYWDGTTLNEGQTTPHAAKQTADDVLAWLADTGSREDDWFVHVAFNLCHSPYHEPPAGMHSYAGGTRPDAAGSNDPEHGFGGSTPDTDEFLAMCEALDFQIGRILASANLPDDTVIMICCDNGTPEVWADSPFDGTQAKKTVYDYGTNVPLMIQDPNMVLPGDGTNPRETDILVHTCDIPATIADYFGLDYVEIMNSLGWTTDCVSFRQIITDPNYNGDRKYAYRDHWPDVQDPDETYKRSICNQRFDLVKNDQDAYEMYDLREDPFEATNLLNSTLTSFQQRNYDKLQSKLLEYEIAYLTQAETKISVTED